MTECKYIVIGILIGLLLSRLLSSSSEALVNRPSQEEKSKYANTILKHSSIFQNGTLEKARSVMNWMDAILYEDLRTLAHNNKLTFENILKTLS